VWCTAPAARRCRRCGVADVLKARPKTTGVIERTFTLKTGPDARAVDWKIYDVDGKRSQRQAWAPYFDDASAIIFLGVPALLSAPAPALTLSSAHIRVRPGAGGGMPFALACSAHAHVRAGSHREPTRGQHPALA
jgi:hypothetical protein